MKRHAEKSPIARAVVADEPDAGPLPNQTADIVKDDLLAEGQPKSLDVDQNNPSATLRQKPFSRTKVYPILGDIKKRFRENPGQEAFPKPLLRSIPRRRAGGEWNEVYNCFYKQSLPGTLL